MNGSDFAYTIGQIVGAVFFVVIMVFIAFSLFKRIKRNRDGVSIPSQLSMNSQKRDSKKKKEGYQQPEVLNKSDAEGNQDI